MAGPDEIYPEVGFGVLEDATDRELRATFPPVRSAALALASEVPLVSTGAQSALADTRSTLRVVRLAAWMIACAAGAGVLKLLGVVR